MNIKITHNWLLEFLDTDATPEEIQKFLSLCGPSVERIDKAEDEVVYDIEITSNRVDSASVMGVAREAVAILPRFKKKAVLKETKTVTSALPQNKLTLQITDKENLSSRIMAVIFTDVKIKQSPAFIKKRLEAVGIRSINNVVDITNYVMVETGHPTHVFDFDRVKTGRFIFRTAKKDESLTTLDGKSFVLKGGEIIIDDGTGRIVDLPSIMGTENSVVTEKSKNIIYFIDNLNPVLVRKASMSHGIRTQAATYNEKGVDPELGKLALQRGIELLTETASPISMSKVIDIYPEKLKTTPIKVAFDFIKTRIGVQLENEEIAKILTDLQFSVKVNEGSLVATPPSFRGRDVSIPEDIVEEIARIYGYQNLPNNIQPTVFVKQPEEMDQLYDLQYKIKFFLKHLGLHEVMNYSMTSEKTIHKADLKATENLQLKNTISEEIKYLRSHILPSLYLNIRQNEGKSEELKFFEIAKTYKKRQGDLPIEDYKLAVVVNTSFSDLKGIVEALLDELNISSYEVKKTNYDYFAKDLQAEFFNNKDYLVRLGQMAKKYQVNFGIKKDVFAAVLDFKALMKYSKPLAQYSPISSFAVIKLEQTFENKSYAELKALAFRSNLLRKVELVSVFKNKTSLRFYYSSSERNITEDEAKKELEKIS